MQLLPRRKLQPAVVDLAVLVGPTLVTTMAGAGIGGRPMVEVSLVVVVPRAAVVRMAQGGPETDVKPTTTDVDPAALAGGDQGTPEAAPMAQVVEAVEEEEVPPLARVTTVDEGLVDVSAPN